MQNKKQLWLIKAREKKGLYQVDVAELIGTTQQFYGFIENGKRRPSPEIAQRIGKVLDIDWTEFYKKRRYKQEPEKEE